MVNPYHAGYFKYCMLRFQKDPKRGCTDNFFLFLFFSHQGRTDLPREARGSIDSRGVRTSISKETWARGYKN